ncbi:velvet factor-domain-containing protein [Pilaira anomala]|nr:velvet factor-domain-containing protein [Pilaira anomala]
MNNRYPPILTPLALPKYSLVMRQQPQKARLCSFKDKVDRRPLDPPPIVQLYQNDTVQFNDYYNSANFFLHTTLVNSVDDSDLNYANGNRTTAGSVVQSLHKLKDTNNSEGAFFIFADISVRIEGIFKLKFTLFQINGMDVERLCSVYSQPFQVYSPKTFPGMSESTDLTRSFSDQGVRIRIRKETRASATASIKRKRASHVMSMRNLLITESTSEQRSDYHFNDNL